LDTRHEPQGLLEFQQSTVTVAHTSSGSGVAVLVCVCVGPAANANWLQGVIAKAATSQPMCHVEVPMGTLFTGFAPEFMKRTRLVRLLLLTSRFGICSFRARFGTI